MAEPMTASETTDRGGDCTKMGFVHTPLGRSLIVLGLVALTVVACLLSPDPNTNVQAGVGMELPSLMGNWVGEDQEITQAEKTILPKDTEFARKVYFSNEQDRVMCSIVLAGGEKRSIHRPEACLPGQGWTIRSSRAIPVKLEDGREIKVMNLSLEREVELGPGRRKKIYSNYFYWFVGKDVTTPYHWKRVFLTSWDRVVHQVNHRWAYVIVTSLVTEGLQPNGKNEEETIEMLKQFTAEIAPNFMK